MICKWQKIGKYQVLTYQGCDCFELYSSNEEFPHKDSMVRPFFAPNTREGWKEAILLFSNIWRPNVYDTRPIHYMAIHVGEYHLALINQEK